jgi:hypothetical protein
MNGDKGSENIRKDSRTPAQEEEEMSKQSYHGLY